MGNDNLVDGPIYIELKKRKGRYKGSYNYHDCVLSLVQGMARIEIEGVIRDLAPVFSAYKGFEYKEGEPSVLKIDRSDLGVGECIVVFDVGLDGELLGIEII